MAQPLAAPYCYFTDNSAGAPLAGGKIYTYSAGTTTPKATYTDSGAGTPNANPVVLDSAGKASIWLVGTYKIVVKDSLGNTIHTDDNISAASSNPFSDASALISNSSDPTKQVIIAADLLTTGATRTLHAPDSDGTIALKSATVAAIRRQIVTSTGGVTYTPDAHLLYADVELWGAGGGGGGVNATNGAAAGGGGAGGYSKKLITVATIGASQTVTLGAGGTAGANTGGTGGTGGTSTFGAILSVTGGTGGVGSTSANAGVAGGSGGAGSGGDINSIGAPGLPNSTPNLVVDSTSGTGGSTSLGGGGKGLAGAQNTAGTDGGVNSGGGGGGAISAGSAAIGGAGAVGRCVITEYCSQ